MKSKIIALLLSAALIFTCLTVGTYAAELKSEVFTLTTTEENLTFEMKKYDLPDESRNFINTMFDKTLYDATVYDAYKASLSDADGLAVAFTEDMDVTINIGDSYFDTEIFVFAVNENSGIASGILAATRNGADLTIEGEAFKPVSGDIIVVMTSNKSLMTGPEYTLIPAIICAGVAVIAITVSVLVVKKKSSKETITD